MKTATLKGQLSKLIAKVLFFVRGDMFFITVRSSFPMTRTMVVGTWSGWHIVFLGYIILIGIWSQFVNLVNQFKSADTEERRQYPQQDIEEGYGEYYHQSGPATGYCQKEQHQHGKSCKECIHHAIKFIISSINSIQIGK